GEAITRAVVAVFADGVFVVNGGGEGGGGIDGRLDVVNTAAVVVIGAADDEPELLLIAKAPSVDAAELIRRAAIEDRCVTAVDIGAELRPIVCHLGAQIDRTGDPIGILIGGESLVDFDGVHQVG